MSASASAFAHASDLPALQSASTFGLATTAGLPRHRPLGGHLKRAVDVALALIAIVLLAPLFVLVAALLRVSLGRPVLVGERCVGFAGRVFTAYAFRTPPMPHVRKLAGESHVAMCLASLRDARLDRLPRLLSVLHGDMSFVGPQPITLDMLNGGGSCAQDYFLARPGLLGLRQSARSGKLAHVKRAARDRYYVRRWSLRLDLALLAKAIVSVR